MTLARRCPQRFMTDLAIREADDPGSPVTWREHMTDEEYNAAPRGVANTREAGAARHRPDTLAVVAQREPARGARRRARSGRSAKSTPTMPLSVVVDRVVGEARRPPRGGPPAVEMGRFRSSLG
jgi:hypothetical protein